MIEFKLEPTNSDVNSKITIQFDTDMIRMKLYDCDNKITYRFKSINSLAKLERIRVALDIIENELKTRNISVIP